MARLHTVVDGKIALGYWAVPDLMVAFSWTMIMATSLFEQFLEFAQIARHGLRSVRVGNMRMLLRKDTNRNLSQR